MEQKQIKQNKKNRIFSAGQRLKRLIAVNLRIFFAINQKRCIVHFFKMLFNRSTPFTQ